MRGILGTERASDQGSPVASSTWTGAPDPLGQLSALSIFACQSAISPSA